MANLPEGYEPPTPGLSDIWKFWRSIETGDAETAKNHAGVLLLLESLDRETKTIVVNTLAKLRESIKNTRRANVESQADTKYRAEEKLKIILRPRVKHDLSLESNVKNQVVALNGILDSLKKGSIDEALNIYSQLPYQNDRAKVLSSLIAVKRGMGDKSETRMQFGKSAYASAEIMQRESIASLDLPERIRQDVIAQLLKIYMDKLEQ